MRFFSAPAARAENKRTEKESRRLLFVAELQLSDSNGGTNARAIRVRSLSYPLNFPAVFFCVRNTTLQRLSLARSRFLHFCATRAIRAASRRLAVEVCTQSVLRERRVRLMKSSVARKATKRRFFVSSGFGRVNAGAKGSIELQERESATPPLPPPLPPRVYCTRVGGLYIALVAREGTISILFDKNKHRRGG